MPFHFIILAAIDDKIVISPKRFYLYFIKRDFRFIYDGIDLYYIYISRIYIKLVIF